MSKVAAIQMASGPNVNANLLEAGRLIASAVKAGAQLVVLPENFAFMGMQESDKLEISEAHGEGPIQAFLSKMAARYSIWLVGGSIPLLTEVSGKVAPACLIFNSVGEEVARFDKIHLFDVHLVDVGERYQESNTWLPGDTPVVVETPFGKIGIVVCYDLRFPELARLLVDQGAEILVVPAAFTAVTGRAHWEVLLRARAIENLSYVVAAAQGGYHKNGRETHGDSMVVDPWGNILDRLQRGSGVVIADLSRGQISSTREHFPCLDHRRLKC